MPASIRASVPGKLILMGEHAAVYGRPALVAAVGLRARVTVDLEGDAGVHIVLEDLGIRTHLAWSQLVTYAERARTAWQAYAERPTPERFAAVQPAALADLATAGDPAALAPAHLVMTALGELAAFAGSSVLPSISLAVRSELPVGAGFGSSAAVAVGVLAATSHAIGMPLERPALDRLALEVERRQHGLPSGADHAAVIRGGVLRIVRGLEVAPVEVAPETLERFAVFNSGCPEAGTGEVVASVRALRERDPNGFERLLDRMAENVLSFARELSRIEPDWSELAVLIHDYEDCLERIGVVPEAVRRTLEETRAAGSAGKVSGAGGLSDAGAGSILVLCPESGALPDSLAAYPAYPAGLGSPGLSVEVEG